MKPSFALNLTETSITLLHRTKRGWMDVGTVSFGDPDMVAALDYLRSTALGLSASGIATKLIIPDSQILYLQVEAPGPDDVSRRAQVEAALDGRTPYALDELAFDWVVNGAMVDVAVVARETLSEAESFATEHRFNPVSFVGRAETGFGKEPFFGMTYLAPGLIGSDETVEPDPQPVTIVAREVPRSESSASETKPATPTPETPAPETPAPEVPVPDAPGPDAPVPVPDPTAPDLPEPPPEVPADPVPDAPVIPDLPPADLPEPELPAPTPIEDPAPDQPAFDLPPHDPPQTPATLRNGAADQDAAEAPMAVDVPMDEPVEARPPQRAASASVLSGVTPPDEDLPPPLSAAALTAFASRRAAEDVVRPLGTAAPPDAGAARAVAPSALRPAATATKPVVERPAAARPVPKFSYDDPVPPPQRLPGDPPAATGAVMGKAGKGLRSIGSMVTSPTIPGAQRRKKGLTNAGPVPRPALAGPEPAVSASTLTASADGSAATAPMKAAAQTLSRPQTSVSPEALGRGLGARTMPPRGKPRFLGLILTGVLLLILALVAAWSSLYLTRVDDAPAAVASVEDEALADGVDLAAADLAVPETPGATGDSVPDQTVQDIAAPEPVAEPEPEPVAEAAPDPAPEAAPKTAVDAVAAAAVQPAAAAQDEIFLAAMDMPPRLSDPLVLPPPPMTGDALPAAQMLPPPFGTVYQFDADGRIVPTADGIVTPEGVTLVAGAPPVRPPQRPVDSTVPVAAPVVAPVAAPAAATVTSTELSPDETFAADPSLADARPRVRPEGLAPAAAEAESDASLAPPSDSRFASLRPRARPAEVLAAGEAARRASESASLALQSQAIEAAVASAEAANLSPLAVSVSRTPAPRPRDLSRAVEAAVAAATRQAPREEPQQAVAAASTAATSAARPPVADEDDDEPEIAASAAPNIPTRANVAKQATFTNAINLSRINLIGVYGTQSNRSALVRQANGRYRKVSVGDSLDGGRVQAITATEVRYQKGGRLLSLSLPKG